MTTKEIYNLAIQMGIKADFRGEEGVKKLLERRKQEYEKLSPEEKEKFDLESLENPFSDSRILHIAQDKEIKKVLV